MKRVLLLLIFGCFLLVTINGCGNTRGHKNSRYAAWMSENGKKKILCTTAMISSLVEKLCEDQADCLTLISGDHDPHSYQLVKGDDEKLQRADIIFFNGLGLEHGQSLYYRLKDSPKAYAVGDYILQSSPKSILYIDGTADPHVWMDVSLWSQTIPFIAEKLITLLPDCKDDIKMREKALIDELNFLHESLKMKLLDVPEKKRYMVSTHDAFNYFARAYLATSDEIATDTWQMRVQAPEGLAPESQLSTKDICRLVEHVQKFHIHVVFGESNVSKDSLNKVIDACEKNGYLLVRATEPLFADSIGPYVGAESYMNMMNFNVDVIVRAFLQDAQSHDVLN